MSQEKKLTQQKINEILSEIKKSDMSRVIFKNSQMYKYFPRYYSAEQMKEEIIALLEKDYKRKKRQRKKEEKKAGQGSSAADQNHLHGKETIEQTTDY